MGLLALSLHSQCLYQTSFEAEGEPFGNWKVSNTITKGNATTLQAHTGSSSMSPGYGTGRYGTGKSMDFDPPLQADKIWISFWQYADKQVNYMGFMSISGQNENKERRKIISKIFDHKSVRIGHPQKRYNTDSLLGAWHKHEYELDFTKQNFNYYLDGKKISGAMAFEYKTGGGEDNIINLTQLVLGGNGSRVDATYYDDLYIGTERTAPMAEVRMRQVSGKVDTRAFMQIGRLRGAAPTVDGKLDDPCWQHAAAFSPMMKNVDNSPTNYTQAYAAYDNEKLYIAVRAWDGDLDPVKNQLHQIVKGNIGANARAWTADSVEIFVAPKQTSPDQYYQFAINLAGGYDVMSPQKNDKRKSNLQSSTQLYDHYWEMEIIIPLSELDVSGDLAGKRWFFNFCRNKRGGDGKNAVWAPTNGSYHNYSKFGEIEFVEQAPRIELQEQAISSGKEGSNNLTFKITSDKEQTLLFRNHVIYQNADSTVGETSVQVQANKVTEVKTCYFVSASTSERKSSENFSCNYEIRGADGKLIQRSGFAAFPLERYTPIKNRFMCTTSNILFKYFNNLYINQASTRSMLLMLQVDAKLLPKTNNVSFQIEMPEYISLLALDAKDKKSCIPTNIKEQIISKNGKKHRMVSMDIDRKWLYSLDEIGLGPKQRRYNDWILFTFDCTKDATLGDGEKITYSSKALIDGKTYQSQEGILNLHVLPPIQGAQFPTSYSMTVSLFPWIRPLNYMSYQERERFFENLFCAGINRVSYFEDQMSEDLFRQIRSHGFSVTTDIPVNKARNYRSHAFPGVKEYLKNHPEHRAVDRSGETHNDCICLEILAQKNSPYDKEMQKWIAPYARKYEGLSWDYEVPPAAASSICFCERCLKAFAETAGLESSVKREEIPTRHLKQWTDFQAKRVAKICGKLYLSVKKANPNCDFGFYSGYQGEQTLKAYSVDWRYYGDVIDHATSGYGRPLQAIKDTKNAIGNKKLTLGLLMQVWHGGSQYDYVQFNNSLWRRLTDADGGILFFADMQIDGRFFEAVGKASRIIKENFDFFNHYQRGDELCRIHGTGNDNMTVLRNDKGERIIVLFNALGQAQDYTLECLNIPPDAKLKDASTGKSYSNPAKAVINVPRNNVVVLSLRK